FEYGSIEPTFRITDAPDRPCYIGSERVGQAGYRAVARHDINRIAALRLDDGAQLPTLDKWVAAERQFIYRTADDAVPYVEIRKAAVATQVIAVLNDDALRAERIVVD